MAEINILELFLRGIFAPPILFFVFGIITVLVKADLEIPPTVSTAITVFLMASIGLEGGAEAIEALKAYPEVIGAVLATAVSAILLAVIFATWTGKILKHFVGFTTADAWASAGHYAAVSSATVFIGVTIARYQAALVPVPSDVYAGWMPAMYPFMDTTALVTAIILGRMAITKEALGVRIDIKKILRITLLGAGIWALQAALLIGILATAYSPVEMDMAMNFFDDLFRGILCIFLIDMGMSAGRQLWAIRELGKKIFKAIFIALMLPQLHGVLGILVVYLINYFIAPGAIGWADAFVFATIAGGASFITAPAAMRSGLPEANPSIYLPMSIALTFPFNIMIGMPIWQMLAMTLWGVV
jgi:hypothetical protein